MYFIVREESTEVYPEDQIISLNFWLKSGEDILELDDLAVTIVGSNDCPFWVNGDESAFIEGVFPFSETRLYFLGLNRPIPPETWVEVVVLLENLVFDPVYEYITGFYLKNDEGFYNTIYIDNIRLIPLAP